MNPDDHERRMQVNLYVPLINCMLDIDFLQTVNRKT